jgi:hypothetical protein
MILFCKTAFILKVGEKYMKKVFGVASVFILILCYAAIFLWLRGLHIVDSLLIFIVYVFPAIGLLLGLFAEKNKLRVTGIVGNLILLAVTILYPIVIRIIWGGP